MAVTVVLNKELVTVPLELRTQVVAVAVVIAPAAQARLVAQVL